MVKDIGPGIFPFAFDGDSLSPETVKTWTRIRTGKGSVGATPQWTFRTSKWGLFIESTGPLNISKFTCTQVNLSKFAGRLFFHTANVVINGSEFSPVRILVSDLIMGLYQVKWYKVSELSQSPRYPWINPTLPARVDSETLLLSSLVSNSRDLYKGTKLTLI